MKLAAAATVAATLVLCARAEAAPAPQVIVVCAPGSPGATAEAQPAMDAFAAAIAAKAGTPLTAVYDESEAGGVKRLASAGIGIVSLPFFLAHEKELGLHARLQPVAKGRPDEETWQLVAAKGKVTGAGGLTGFTIVSNAAYAPGFVRGPVLGAWGLVPADVKLQQSSAVLSALKRASNGEPIAVLLDGPQAAALASLPYASKLEVVAKSPAMPVGIVATVDAKLNDKAWAPIGAALVALRNQPAGATALDGITMDHFAPVDTTALDAARKAFAK